jgi:hypothetical protein
MIVLSLAMALAGSSPGRAQDTRAADELKSQILASISAFSDKANIAVDPGRLFYSTIKGGIVATVPARGVEAINLKELRGAAVDLGVVLLTVDIATADGKQVPPGVYKTRLVISEDGTKGRAELADEVGKTVAAVDTEPPKIGKIDGRSHPAPHAAMYQLGGARESKLIAASSPTRVTGAAQYGGSSFTRCYGFLLFCCESRDSWDPRFGRETICRWCGFCFGFWF